MTHPTTPTSGAAMTDDLTFASAGSAGAGSILSGDYHGFLHHGAFTAG